MKAETRRNEVPDSKLKFTRQESDDYEQVFAIVFNPPPIIIS
jgi:hypothetical protein